MTDSFDLHTFLKVALAEDIGEGDITSYLTVPEDATTEFTIGTRQDITVCGVDIAKQVFALVDPTLSITLCKEDASTAKAGETLIKGYGSARAILTAERTALNLLMHLSGIATLTAQYVAHTKGTHAKVLDTRKTLPGLRALQKYAVTMGGGTNHRMRLDDAILIKDNHIQLCGGNITKAVTLAKQGAPKDMMLIVECDTLEQAHEALEAGATRLLLDNMENTTLKAAAALNQGRAALEASGNVSLETIQGIAQTGVDYISIGKLTHSAMAADIGLDMQ